MIANARGYDPASVAVASALLERAADSELALRALFEAAVPRLVHLSRKALGYARQSFCPELVDPDHPVSWSTPDQVTADTIGYAFEWITVHAGESIEHPIRAMRDGVRDRLRVAATKAIREQAAHRRLREQPRIPIDRLSYRCRSSAEQLRDVLHDALAQGVITADDAELVFCTRALSLSLDDAAAQRGVVYDTVRKRRRRAENAMCAAVIEHPDLETVA